MSKLFRGANSETLLRYFTRRGYAGSIDEMACKYFRDLLGGTPTGTLDDLVRLQLHRIGLNNQGAVGDMFNRFCQIKTGITDGRNPIQAFFETNQNFDFGLTSNVQLLVNFDGVDAATDATDASANNHDLTFGANTTLSTTAPKFGTASVNMTGTGSFISIPDHATWDLISNNAVGFYTTIDFWVKLSTLTGTQTFFAQYEDANNYYQFRHVDGTGMNFFAVQGGATIINLTSTGADEINDTNWHHIAFIRWYDGTPIRYAFYLDGIQLMYLNDASTDTHAGLFYIGSLDGGTTHNLFGNIDEFRWITSNWFGADPNSARTDTITVPITAYS